MTWVTMLKELMSWIRGRHPTPSDDFRRVVLESSSQDKLLEQVRARVEEIRRLSNLDPLDPDKLNREDTP